MSIASRISAIEEHLTDDYSVLELAGADLSNVDKNIVNLSPTWKERLLYFINNGTEEVYDNWEKVSEEGESLTLNNTLEARMKIELKGNTYQEGTPTPENPQDIQVVSGDNTIKVEGKNLFDKNSATVLNALISTTTHKITASAGRSTTYIEIKPNTTYTVSKILSSRFVIATFTDLDAEYTSKAEGATNTSLTVTSGANDKYLAVFFYHETYDTSLTPQEILNTIQIEYGNQSSNYTPYVSQSYPINLPVENLFDKSSVDIVQAHMSVSGHTIKLQSGNYTAIFPCKPNTTYTIQKIVSTRFVVMQSPTLLTLTSTTQTIENVQSFGENTSGTLTTLGTTNYLYIEFYGGSDETAYQQTLDSLQIEKGDKANHYTPYGTTPIELCKIGTYQDKIAKSTGKNLFNPSNFITKNNVSCSSQGAITSTGIASTAWGYANRNYEITLQSGTYNITLFFNTKESSNDSAIRFFDSNSTLLLATNNLSNLATSTSTLTLTQETNVGIMMKLSNGICFMQIEKGTSSSSYEPYGTSWYLNKQIGKVVLNGSENWNYDTSGVTGIISSSIQISSMLSGNYLDGLTTYFHNDKSGKAKNSIRFGANNKYIYLYLDETEYTSANDVKAFLSTHNTDVYYVLATPTYEEITDTTLLSQLNALGNANSYNEQTNINQDNNDLASILNASALENI